MSTVGRFMELNNTIHKIAHLLVDVENANEKDAQVAKKICKLLYYTEKNPLEQPDSNRISENKPSPTFETIGDSMEYIMNKRVLLVPRVPAQEERGSFIVVILDDFRLSENGQFKPHIIMFDILCHHDDWLLNNSLRPYVIMQQIDDLFNNRKISAGKLQFFTGKSVVLTPQMVGYSLVYDNVTIN
jgi:hypothetical protein